MAAIPESFLPQGPDVWREPIMGMRARGVDTSTLETILARVDSVNLAEEISDEELARLGLRVHEEFEIDQNSRDDWEQRQQEYIDAAKQALEEKSYPWPKAANVKYPLLTTAAIQFNARAYPQIVQGSSVVKVATVGRDDDNAKADRARRLEEWHNYQLLHDMEDWPEGMDRVLLLSPILGTCFKKLYYDPVSQKDCAEVMLPDELVVNYKAPSFARAPRKTQLFCLYPHEIESRKREGVFLDIDLPPEDKDGDEDQPVEFLEQHRRYDLDGDGYAEPVIVTLHKGTRQVARVVAGYDEDGVDIDTRNGQVVRIEPLEYFVKYGFIPNPESAIYDLGFGDLLRSIGGTIDTTLNQMLDAGHIQNVPFWFQGRGMRMRAGRHKIAPGMGIPVESSGSDLRNNIYVPNFGGPSPVLFQLLGLLIDAGKDITSVKDVLSGEMPVNAPATTTMAVIEQGLQVFGALYKRVHRSLGKELKILYRLNGRYMPPEKYFRALDSNEQLQVLLEDFEDDDMDVVPVSDPTVVSTQQRLAKAQSLLQFNGDPLVNQMEIRQRYFRAIEAEQPAKLVVKPDPNAPPPPEAQKAMAEAMKIPAEMELRGKELELKEREQALREQMAPIERIKTYADAMLAAAKAEGEESGNTLAVYDRYLRALDVELKALKVDDDYERDVRRVAGQPGNAGGNGQGSPGGGPGGGFMG